MALLAISRGVAGKTSSVVMSEPAVCNTGGASEPSEPSEPSEAPEPTPKRSISDDDASEGVSSGRASPTRLKRSIPPPEDVAVEPTTKKPKTELSIYVYDRDRTTAEALGAKYRENSLTKYKYWYIPPDVSALNRKILLGEFGKRKSTPFPPVASAFSSTSSVAQTPGHLYLEPSQVSPVLQTILECNRTLVAQFNTLTEKLSASVHTH